MHLMRQARKRGTPGPGRVSLLDSIARCPSHERCSRRAVLEPSPHSVGVEARRPPLLKSHTKAKAARAWLPWRLGRGAHARIVKQ